MEQEVTGATLEWVLGLAEFSTMKKTVYDTVVDLGLDPDTATIRDIAEAANASGETDS